jgi:hypothetical protein
MLEENDPGSALPDDPFGISAETTDPFDLTSVAVDPFAESHDLVDPFADKEEPANYVERPKPDILAHVDGISKAQEPENFVEKPGTTFQKRDLVGSAPRHDTMSGWQEVAATKDAEFRQKRDELTAVFQAKYPSWKEGSSVTGTLGMPMGGGTALKPGSGKPTYAELQSYKGDLALLTEAIDRLGNVVGMPEDGHGNFLTEAKSNPEGTINALATAGFSGMLSDIQKTSIARKVQAGEPLTIGEQAAFDAQGIFDGAYSNIEGGAFKLGRVVTQGVPFIESMLLTSGTGLAGKAGEVTVKQLAKQQGIKLLSGQGAKLIGKEAGKVLVQSAKLSPLRPTTWQRQQTGMAGEMNLDDSGNWIIDKDSIEGFLEATAKGAWTSTMEYGTEGLGGLMGDFGGVFHQMSKNVPGLKNFRIPPAVTKIAKAAKINSAPTEIFEELLNIPLQAPTGDQPLSEVGMDDIWETIWLTAGFTTILGMAAFPAGAIHNIRRHRDYNLIKKWGRENVNAVTSAIEGGTSEDLNTAIEAALISKPELSYESAQKLFDLSLNLATERTTRIMLNAGKKIAADAAEAARPKTEKELAVIEFEAGIRKETEKYVGEDGNLNKAVDNNDPGMEYFIMGELDADNFVIFDPETEEKRTFLRVR